MVNSALLCIIGNRFYFETGYFVSHLKVLGAESFTWQAVIRQHAFCSHKNVIVNEKYKN